MASKSHLSNPLPGGALAAWVLNWVWIPALGIQVLFFLLFPDGRVPGPRWRVVLGLAALGSAIAVLRYRLSAVRHRRRHR